MKCRRKEKLVNPLFLPWFLQFVLCLAAGQDRALQSLQVPSLTSKTVPIFAFICPYLLSGVPTSVWAGAKHGQN